MASRPRRSGPVTIGRPWAPVGPAESAGKGHGRGWRWRQWRGRQWPPRVTDGQGQALGAVAMAGNLGFLQCIEGLLADEGGAGGE